MWTGTKRQRQIDIATCCSTVAAVLIAWQTFDFLNDSPRQLLDALRVRFGARGRMFTKGFHQNQFFCVVQNRYPPDKISVR